MPAGNPATSPGWADARGRLAKRPANREKHKGEGGGAGLSTNQGEIRTISATATQHVTKAGVV